MLKAFSNLRARVLLLIAVPFAILLTTTVNHTLDMREDRLTNAETHVLETARLMAAKQQQIIEHIHEILSSTALLPEVRRGLASQECNRVLAVRRQQEPNLNNIVLVLTNGDVICNATPTSQRTNLGDRDHFKAAILTRQLSIGGYVIGRDTGRPGIGFALPMLDEAGVPRAVVATTLSLAWLEQELAKAQLPAGSRVAVMDGEGLVLARHPDPEHQVGKSAVDLPLWRNILAKGGEGTEEGIDQDGLRKIYGFVPLHRTASGQAYLWISIPKDTVTGPVEHAFVLSLLAAVALLVLTFGAVWLGGERFFVRRIAALVGVAKQLGDGNLASRTGFKADGDEIGQLAQSFNQMAERLQMKETQLSRTVRALRVLSAGNHAMLHAKHGEQQLLKEMCRAIGEAGGYRLVWVGYTENNTEKSIRPVARWGSVAEGYFENVKFTWSDTESGRAPPGRAIRTGKPAVVQNIQKETGPQPWQDYALRCGCGACLALPLRTDDHVIGMLNICAGETDAFSDEEVSLLSEAAADLSFGIASQRAEVEHAGMTVTLKTAEERFRAAAEANLDALFILKSVRDEAGHLVDFEFTDINLRAAEMLGRAHERIIGQKLCELLPFERTGGLFDKYVRTVATGTPLEEEFLIDTPEIKAKWLRHQVVRVGDGIAISSQDITLWKESGARLSESEERLRLAMTAAHMGVWTWDLKSDKFSLLEGVEPIFGLPPGEGSYTPEELIEAVYPVDRDLLVRALSQGREKGMPIRVEFRTAKSDGAVLWVEGQSSFIRGATGAPERGVGVVMDITERKRASEDLAASEKKFRDLVEKSSDWIWEIDERSTYTYCSPKVQDLLGYVPQELIGKSPFDLMQPLEAARIAAFIRPFLAEKKPVVAHENINIHKDGREVVLETSSVPIFDSQGTFKGYRGVDRDITGRRRSERALNRANRALRTLSACNEALILAVSEPELLNTVCKLAVESGGYCMAGVRFAEQDVAKTVRIVAQYGNDEGYLDSMNITWADTEQGHGPTGTAIRTGTMQVNQNMLTNPNMAPWRDAALARGFQSSIAMPLKGPYGTLGALTLYAHECDAFDKDEVQLLEKLADDLAFGITTLRTRIERDRMAYAHQHHEEILRKSLEESIQAIANTLEMRDPYTAGHQKRVAKLAVAIASGLRLPTDEVHGIHLAASIHDLGKIQVPAEILSKPSKLSDIEFMLIKTHAQAGYDILKGIEFPWPIATMVLQHHEKLDGSGYPQGLKGDQILMGSRIIAVADVVEAMASHRPYRPSLGVDAALQEIEKGRGTVYDPAVVDVCLKLFREEQFALT